MPSTASSGFQGGEIVAKIIGGISKSEQQTIDLKIAGAVT